MASYAESYWANPMHENTHERLTQCDPEATIELLDMLDTGTRPTIGWWKRRIRVGDE